MTISKTRAECFENSKTLFHEDLFIEQRRQESGSTEEY